MASLTKQHSRLILTTIFLLKFFQMFDTVETNSNKRDLTFESLLETFNKYGPDVNNSSNLKNDSKPILNSSSLKNDTFLNDIGIERRSDGGGSAWQCESEINWKDLGNFHYPRFVKEVLCVGRSCMHGYYRCASQNYTIRVLSTRQNGDNMEIALPRDLREEWKLIDIQVSVGCICRS